MKTLLQIILFFISTNFWGQNNDFKLPLYHDSILSEENLKVIKSIDSLCSEINTTTSSNPNQIKIDTLEVQIEYSIKNQQGNFILQNPYSFLPDKNLKDTVVKREVVIVSNSQTGKVLTVKAPALYSSFLAKSVNTIYLKDGIPIKQAFSCNNPNDFIGSCGGTYSTYNNYFKNGTYYTSIIGGQTYYCGCGFNYIITSVSINSIINQFNSNLRDKHERKKIITIDEILKFNHSPSPLEYEFIRTDTVYFHEGPFGKKYPKTNLNTNDGLIRIKGPKFYTYIGNSSYGYYLVKTYKKIEK